MLEEFATVVRTEGAMAWVQTSRSGACGSCSARAGCGTGALGKVLGRRVAQVRVINTIQAEVGERVVIGLHEGALVQGSLAVYIVPILALFLAGAFGKLLAAHLGMPESAEAISIATGLLGLGGGFLWLRNFAGRIRSDEQYQPVMVRRLAGGIFHREVAEGAE